MEYDDRLALALEAARVRFEARGQFLSDDDVLDIADNFTTSDRTWLHDDTVDPLDPRIDSADYDRLCADLFALCFEEN